MIREQIQNLKTDRRALRQFGLMIGGVVAVLGALLWLRHQPAGPWLLGPGTLLVLLGALTPRTLKHLYLGWMSVAFVLGFVVSTLLLTLFFYLLVTPLGLLARLSGRDFLDRQWSPSASSYWRPRRVAGPKLPADYERQF
jgi:hypothetical protein